MLKTISAAVLITFVSLSASASNCEIRLYRYQQVQQQQPGSQPYGYRLEPELTLEQTYSLENFTLDQCTAAFYQVRQQDQLDPALSTNRVLEIRFEVNGLVLTHSQELQYSPPARQPGIRDSQQRQLPQHQQHQQQQPQQQPPQQQSTQPQQNNCGDN